MTDACPAPPIALGVELTDFQFMPLEILRLRRSRAWLICKRRPELAFYMLNLWTAAWHARPAGSLEEDDDVLADLAMCHPIEWPKVKEDVLRGWIKCSDGRLYHPVVVEKVRDAWRSKMKHHYDKDCGRLRKAAERAGQKNTFVPPTFEEWERGRVSTGQRWMSNGQMELSDGLPVDKATCPTDADPLSTKCPVENALKGEVRERKGRSKGHTTASDLSGGRPLDKAECPPDNGEGGRAQAGSDWGAIQRIQAAYPKRAGRTDWDRAEHFCHVLIDQQAQTWATLEAAAQRYAQYTRATDAEQTQHVMMPGNFFGASDKPWSQPWALPEKRGRRQVGEAFDRDFQSTLASLPGEDPGPL